MTEQVMAAQNVRARQELAAQQRRDEARRMYQESVDAELPMTARALGEAFGRSARWGRDRIAEVRDHDTTGQQEPAGMPPTAPAEPALTDVPAQAPAAEADSPAEEPATVPEPRQPEPRPAGMPANSGGMPRRPEDVSVRPVRSWPVLLLALPAFVAIWGGWVGLGELTGFGEINLLPGIVGDGGWATINSAITLPIGVETYAAYALRAWLSGNRVPVRARRFAKYSAIGSLSLGFLGQVAYHQMVAARMTVAPWWITTLVSGLPVAVLGMGAALAHLLHADGSER